MSLGALGMLDRAGLRKIATERGFDVLEHGVEWVGAASVPAPVVELPVAWVTFEGQHVQGRTDVVLRTATGWILMDHKSTPQGRDQWGDRVTTHAGQLAKYRDVLQAVSGWPVAQVWLVLPVAGAALRVEVG